MVAAAQVRQLVRHQRADGGLVELAEQVLRQQQPGSAEAGPHHRRQSAGQELHRGTPAHPQGDGNSVGLILHTASGAGLA